MDIVLAVIAIIVLAIFFGAIALKNLLYVCEPNEVLVFSGARGSNIHGGRINYHVIKGGSQIKLPIVETVDRVDLTNMIIEVIVRNAYSKGGIPLTVQGVANIKIPGEMPLLHNALERFLGRSREDIMRVARETLEGNLRGVLAGLTPEEVNRDKEAFASKLTDEAGHDLERIGLVLDTLNIQNVSDDVGYLDAIGRTRSAHIRRNAQIAEAQSQADAAEVKWQNEMEGELARLDAAIKVAQKDNETRITNARTRREALISEQKAEVQALLAQTSAEIGMQEARIEQVRLQLQADVVRPAEAQRDQRIAEARAGAAQIIEQGKATAQVLSEISEAYRGQGTAGRDVLLMQKLVPVLKLVSGTIGDMHVDRLTVIGGGKDDDQGQSLAGKLIGTNEQLKAATGVDLAGVLRDRLAPTEQPERPVRGTWPPPKKIEE